MADGYDQVFSVIGSHFCIGDWRISVYFHDYVILVLGRSLSMFEK